MGHFLAALLAKLFADEIKAWLPFITDRLIRAAVHSLAENQRERYSEEWRSHLDQIPGDIAKLFLACELLFAATKISINRSVASYAVPFVLIALFLPVYMTAFLLQALNSRRLYTVPVTLNHPNLEIILDGIPLGLALRYALSPNVSVVELESSSLHYSIWRSTFLIEFEGFLWGKVLRSYPKLSFGMKRSPIPLRWRNARI